MNNIVDSTSNPLANSAKGYAGRGWRIIPLHSFADGSCTCETPNCSSPAKHPLTPNGVHGATTEQTTINSWWNEADIANVGIATGNGLLVLDIDAKHGGLESLARLEAQHGTLPITPTVATGGGGKHFYFRLPDGLKVGNRAGMTPGIDVRGEGGYVVAPPSLHASGQRYAWNISPDTPLAEAPEWLLVMLGARSASATAQPIATKAKGIRLTMQPSTLDLANHPGVGEGERNAMLCKLVGVHLARGDDAEDIEPLAMAWGERCSPPMDEAEVLRTLTSLANKHQPSSSVVFNKDPNDDLDAYPLPEPPQWPTLDDAALYGVLGEVVRLMEPETEADPFGILISLLVVFGNAVGRGPHFPVAGDHHHANLFAVLVGDSSRGRKGTSLGRTLSLFNEADADWLRDCHTTGLSSGERLIMAVRDPVEVLEPVKDKGKITSYQNVIKDNGVTDKRLLVVEPEFAQTLKVLRREGNTLSPVVRQAWDSGSLSVMTKNNAARATGTHVSILGHITRPELSKCLCDTDCFNGFANRFLWVLVRRSKLLPDGGNGLDLRSLQRKLEQALAVARTIGAMNRSPDARSLWHQLYPELTAEKPGLYGAVVGRGEAQTLRLSMLYALLDGSSTIDVAHLRAAASVWRYCESSARIIFDEGQAETADPLEQLLLQMIRQEPGINRRGIHRKIGGHIPAREMVNALARLRDRGQAHCEMIATGGRPSECWFPDVAPQPIVVTPMAVAESAAEAPLGVADATPVQTPAVVSEPEATLMVASLSLSELFDAVNAINGNFRHDGNSVIVDAPVGTITSAINAALAVHQEWLAEFYPTPMPHTDDVEAVNSDRVISEDAFLAELTSV
ncbi:MAG: bifunctional DNA primase/polymerase [Planctomycetaceae bacterium]